MPTVSTNNTQDISKLEAKVNSIQVTVKEQNECIRNHDKEISILRTTYQNTMEKLANISEQNSKTNAEIKELIAKMDKKIDKTDGKIDGTKEKMYEMEIKMLKENQKQDERYNKNSKNTLSKVLSYAIGFISSISILIIGKLIGK